MNRKLFLSLLISLIEFSVFAEIQTLRVNAKKEGDLTGYIIVDDTTREEYYTRKEIRKLKKPVISFDNEIYTFLKDQEFDIVGNDQILTTFKYERCKFDEYDGMIAEIFVISEGKGLMRTWKVKRGIEK